MEFLKRAERNAWVHQFIIFNWKLVHFSIFVVPTGQRGDGEVPWSAVGVGGTSSDSHFFPIFGSGSIRLKRCQAKEKAHNCRLSMLRTNLIC